VSTNLSHRADLPNKTPIPPCAAIIDDWRSHDDADLVGDRGGELRMRAGTA